MVWLAILSGIGFSLVAVAYRLGAARGITPLHIMGTCAVAGTAVFGFSSAGAWREGAPALVVALGLGVGVSQYLLLHLLRIGLMVGPISPLWCVLMLSFVPVTLYACLALGEALVPTQYAAIAAAVLCVVLASMGKAEAPPGRAPEGMGLARRLKYAAVLAALLVFGGVSGACIKELGVHPVDPDETLMSHYHDLFLAMLYLGIAGCVLADQILTRSRPASWRGTFALGALAAAGSIPGMAMLVRSSVLPAAIVFPVNSVSSILATATVASVLLGERRSWSWYATLACGVLAVLLANGEGIVAYLSRNHPAF